jgi:hypothetical protein
MGCKLLGCKNTPITGMRSEELFGTINYISYCEEHAKERYFQDKIKIDKLDYHICGNMTLPIEMNDPEEELSRLIGNNFAIYRDSGQVYISYWR